MRLAIGDLETSPHPDSLPEYRERENIGVAFAGAGLISAFGNLQRTWEKLLAGQFISDHAKATRGVVSLAFDAARDAVGEAGWSEEELRSAGLVVGTSKGKVVEWISGGASAEANPTADPTADAAGVGSVAAQLGMTGGPRLTVSAACASGLLALIRGALMIKAKEAKRVLVVAAEASVHELFIASFRRLGVLAKSPEGCRPFDRQRSGFLMSEAGAAICLQGVDDAEGGDVLIDLMAMGGDATHLVGGDERGRTLRALLHDVIDGRPVDLIHAHGTGTVANDEMELGAIDDCIEAVGGMRPALYSHKGALGHSLGAAGLVSVVINRMCHEKNLLPPMLGQDLMAAKNVELCEGPSKRRVRRSIVVAAGFGGAMGVVSLLG